MEEIVVCMFTERAVGKRPSIIKPIPIREVIGFDYYAQSPWKPRRNFSGFFTERETLRRSSTLVANSIVRFLSLVLVKWELVDTVSFISPWIDMEQLICNMIQCYNVSSRTCREGIPTAFWRNAVVNISTISRHPIHENPTAFVLRERIL